MSTTAAPDTTKWGEFDWIDTHPFPGEFIGKEGDFDIHGDITHGLNYSHAYHTWVKKKLCESGGTFGRCCLCNQPIRYMVLWSDGTGAVHATGEDCARFVASGMASRRDYDEYRAMRAIKRVKTKRGERCVLKIDMPSGFWNIPASARPAFVSTSNYKAPVRGARLKWYVSIWGESEGEVIDNIQVLRELLKSRTK